LQTLEQEKETISIPFEKDRLFRLNEKGSLHQRAFLRIDIDGGIFNETLIVLLMLP
jgi:hypothetical protein